VKNAIYAIIMATMVMFGAAANAITQDEAELCQSMGVAAAALHELANKLDYGTYHGYVAKLASDNAGGAKDVEALLVMVGNIAWENRFKPISELNKLVITTCKSAF